MKALHATIEHARLNQFRLRPKLVSALWAGKTIATLHFSQPVKKTFIIGLLQESPELFDSRRPAHEDLDSTGIANQIRLVLLCDPYLPRLRTYGTREHLLAIDSYHSEYHLRTGFLTPRRVCAISNISALFGMKREQARTGPHLVLHPSA